MTSLASTSADVAPPISLEATKRRLSVRQARTVERLAAAAEEELRAVGYEGVTVRSVARRAGVAPATAYTYFASKDHLVTEVFWRRLQALPAVSVDRRRSPLTRLRAVLDGLARMLVAHPELASACTAAMLAGDPDVAVLRGRIGAEIHRRIAEALGDAADPAVLRGLDLAVSGALVQAGMGFVAYADLPAALAEVGGLLLGGRR